jgi:hypothetical protein
VESTKFLDVYALAWLAERLEPIPAGEASWVRYSQLTFGGNRNPWKTMPPGSSSPP